MKTASLFEPYVGGGNGLPMWTQQELDRAAVAYDQRGWQILLHAIGDKAIDMALRAAEFVAQTNGPRDRRFRIEHVEVPRPADLPRFKALGVIASTQALFANPDKTTLENYAVLLGPERVSHANAFRLFDEAGVRQAFGSDWPVFSMEVLKGIYCAVTRQTPAGTPAAGFFPEHRISAEAALRHFTIDGAYASFEEKDKGSLEVGKLADFVILSKDPTAVELTKIADIQVTETIKEGATVFRLAPTGGTTAADRTNETFARMLHAMAHPAPTAGAAVSPGLAQLRAKAAASMPPGNDTPCQADVIMWLADAMAHGG
jgi:predicted amidohydrolase YtcJ